MIGSKETISNGLSSQAWKLRFLSLQLIKQLLWLLRSNSIDTSGETRKGSQAIWLIEFGCGPTPGKAKSHLFEEVGKDLWSSQHQMDCLIQSIHAPDRLSNMKYPRINDADMPIFNDSRTPIEQNCNVQGNPYHPWIKIGDWRNVGTAQIHSPLWNNNKQVPKSHLLSYLITGHFYCGINTTIKV